MDGNVNQTKGTITPGFPSQPSVVDNTHPAGKTTNRPVRSVQSRSQLPSSAGKVNQQRKLSDYSVKKDNDPTRQRKATGLIHRLENMAEGAASASVRKKALTLKGELQQLDYALRRLRQEHEGHPAGARKLASLEDAVNYLKRQEGSLTVYTSKKTGAEFIPYDTLHAMELKPGRVLRTTYGDVLKQGSQLYYSSAKQRLSVVYNSAGKTVEIVRDDWRCDQPLTIEKKYLQHQLARLNEKVLLLEGRLEKQSYPAGAVPIEPFEDRSRYQQVLFDDHPEIRVFVSRKTGKQYGAFDLHRVVPLKPNTITSTRYGDICYRESGYIVSGKDEQLIREEGQLFAVELSDTERVNPHPMAKGKEQPKKQACQLPSPEAGRADQTPTPKETIAATVKQEIPPPRKPQTSTDKKPDALVREKERREKERRDKEEHEKVKQQARPVPRNEPSRSAPTKPVHPRQEHSVERSAPTARDKPGEGKRKPTQSPSGQPPVKQKKPVERPAGARRVENFARSGHITADGFEHFRFFQEEGSSRIYIGYDDHWVVPLIPGHITSTCYGQVYLSENDQLCPTGPGGRFYEKNGEILLETSSKPAPGTPAGCIPMDQMDSSALFSITNLVGEDVTVFVSKKTGKTYVSYDQKHAVEYREGEIVHTQFGDFCNQDGSYLFSGKGSALIKRDGTVRKVTAALREVIPVLKHQPQSARSRLDRLFNHYSKALFVDNGVALDRSSVSEFLTAYEQAIQDEVKVKASKVPAKKDRRLKAIQHLRDFVAGIHDQDDRANELLTIALQCAGRLRERNLVQQTGLPYCGVYSVAQACWASEPERMVLHTLNLALNFYDDDLDVQSRQFPDRFVLDDKNGPMADQLVVASYVRDRINQKLGGTTFNQDKGFLEKIGIPYRSITSSRLDAHSLTQPPKKWGRSLPSEKSVEPSGPAQPSSSREQWLTHLKTLSQATERGAAVRAIATPHCAQALCQLSDQFVNTSSRKAIKVNDFPELLKRSEPAAYRHSLTIDKIQLAPGGRQVRLKLYTWGKSYELELPVEALNQAFESEWHIIGDSAQQPKSS